jgi:hypothetical protein
MEIQPIKKFSITKMIICIILVPFAALSQETTKQNIIFKIVNYRERYSWTDNVILSVENNSNKPVWFSIGEEAMDKDGWFEFNLDVTNPNPLKEAAVNYKVLQPHKLEKINVNLGKISVPPLKKHGVSKRSRFYLKYDIIFNEVGSTKEKKLVTKEYLISW